jgi:hypothetical protein
MLIGFSCRTTQYDPAAFRERLRRLRSTRLPLQRLTLTAGQHNLGHRSSTTITIAQSFQTLGSELPAPSRRRPHRDTDKPCGTHIRHTLSAGQHDPSSLRLTPIRHCAMRASSTRSTSDTTISTAEGPRCDTETG